MKIWGPCYEDEDYDHYDSYDGYWGPNDEYYEEQWPEWSTYEADAWAEPVNDATRSVSSTDDTRLSGTPTDGTASAVISYTAALTAAHIE